MFLNKQTIMSLCMIFTLHIIDCNNENIKKVITEVKCEVDAGSITINRPCSSSSSSKKSSVKTDLISGEGYTAEYSAYNTDPNDKIEMSVAGTVLHILYKKAPNKKGITEYTSEHVDFTLQVPNDCHVEIRGGATDVNLQTISGNVDINVGAGGTTLTNISGNITVQSGSGAVHLNNCLTTLKSMVQQNRVIQYLIKTGSGNIFINNPVAQDITTSTGAGNITVQDITASKVKASTGTGNISASYANSNIQGSFKFNTGTGNVSIQLPSQLKIKQCINGKVKSNFANTQQNPDIVIKGSTGLGTVHIGRQ